MPKKGEKDNMTQNLVITSSPHFHAKDTTRTIMLDVLIALCPALIASVIWFGPRALLVSAVCIGASVLFEYIYRKLMHLDMTIGDLSAAVTGLLLAFNLPSNIPLWMAAIGCFVSIVIAVLQPRIPNASDIPSYGKALSPISLR